MKYLIIYAYQRKGSAHSSFHYDVASDIHEWIKSVRKYDDGRYTLINAIEISDEAAEDINGNDV